jgi:predicted  nucleic acid-binding Zn-ribbon protein
MSVDKTYLIPLWEPTGRQMTEMEALVHTLLEHNAALQREVDHLKANIASLERRMSHALDEVGAGAGMRDALYSLIIRLEDRVKALEEKS